MTITISTVSAGTPQMKQSPSSSILGTSDAPECLSQSTGVKTRKVSWISGDVTRLLWLGYGEGRCLSYWSVSDGYDPFTETARLDLSVDPYDLCTLPNDLVAFSSCNGDISIISPSNNRLSQVKLFSVVHGSGDSRVLTVSNRTLYSGSSNGSVAAIDLESGNTTKFNTGFPGIRGIASFAGGSLLATGHTSGQLLIWDTRDFSEKPVVVTPSKTQLDAITALSTHPAQANIIAFGTDNGAVGFCDVRGASKDILPMTYDIATATITQVLFHPDRSEHLLCSSADGSLVHWDATLANNAFSSGHSNYRGSPWLSDSLSSSVRLNVLKPQSFSAINGIDVSGEHVLAASDIMSLFCFPSVKFGLSPSLH